MSETITFLPIAAVQLCFRSWYGHPEERQIGKHYDTVVIKARAEGDADAEDNWASGLRCWNLLDVDNKVLGRAYEPTETTPWWVWVNKDGFKHIDPPLTLERMTALMVEARLRGGPS